MNYNWKQPNHKYGRNLISSLSNQAHECQKKKSPSFTLPNSYSNLKGNLSGFVNFLWSSYKSWILPRFKYRDFNKSINNRFDVHTANVYRDLRIPYREIRVRRFQIYGDCMLPTIPVIFEISTFLWTFIIYSFLWFFFKFPYNFIRDFRLLVISVNFIRMLWGTLCNTGISYTFYRGKFCSVAELRSHRGHLYIT